MPFQRYHPRLIELQLYLDHSLSQESQPTLSFNHPISPRLPLLSRNHPQYHLNVSTRILHMEITPNTP